MGTGAASSDRGGGPRSCVRSAGRSGGAGGGGEVEGIEGQPDRPGGRQVERQAVRPVLDGDVAGQGAVVGARVKRGGDLLTQAHETILPAGGSCDPTRRMTTGWSARRR